MSNPFSGIATAKAALLMTGATYVSFFFGLLVSAIIARAVGPENFGRYAYVVWISGVLVAVCNNGLNTTGIRFISESVGRGSEDSARAVHGWLRRIQFFCLVATTLGFVATWTFTVPLGWSEHVTVFVGVVLVSVAAKTLYLFDISIAKGFGQYSVEASATVVVGAINLMCVLVLYLVRAPLIAYLVLFAAASSAYAVTAWCLLRLRGIRAATQTLGERIAPRLKSHLWWTVLLAITAAFGNKASETYLLSTHFGPAEVGFFTIAAGVARGGVELLSSGLNSVLMPLMGHAFGAGGTTRVNAILSNAVRYFCFGGFLLAGIGFFWADVAITLIYGSQYHSATWALQVMVVVAGITLAQGAFGALLSTTDNQRIRALFAVLSVGLSVIAALVLVPRYGLTGAVVAHAASSSVIFLLVGVGVVKLLSVSLPWTELFRLVLSAIAAMAVAGACRLAGNGLGWQFIAGLVFAIVFVSASFLFKAWKKDDVEQLMPLAIRYPRLLGRFLLALEKWVRR